MHIKKRNGWYLATMLFLLTACSTSQRGLFEKRTPHEKYKAGLAAAGLSATRLGTLWQAAADGSLAQPLRISIPYQETGYFEMDRPQAAGYLFSAKQGELLTINVANNPQKGFLLFTELWQVNGNDKRLLEGTDTTTQSIQFEVKKTGEYLVRIQPELLQGMAYTITISSGPSLAFPVNKQHNPKVISVWGDSRDANARSHEGIDILAKKYTPVIAIADGVVSNVTEGGLGGKVVFMRPQGKSYSLYYAHLDTQLVQQGQRVVTGDTLGLIGNTGNAKYTPAHLHFGIYTGSGAVDPLPFVNTNYPAAKAVKADTANLRRYARIKNKTLLYPDLTNNSSRSLPSIAADGLVQLLAATDDYYKIQLPDNSVGFVKINTITTQPLRSQRIAAATPLLDRPSSDAAIKKQLAKGNNMVVLGNFENYSFVEMDKITGWVKML